MRQSVNLIFLHGLLGDKSDWQAVITLLQKNTQFRPLALDLPYHGENNNEVYNFRETRQWLEKEIRAHIGNAPFWLIGYSLGGRIALDYSFNRRDNYQLGTIVEGTNLGLNSMIELEARWQQDCHWAQRFAQEPLKWVLNDWYQQPVFADLAAAQRAALIEKRRSNDGTNIAKMLLATSLAYQDYFVSHLAKLAKPLHFLIGERDSKFRQQAQQYQLVHRVIPHAGHNAHWENPQAVAESIGQIIRG